MEMKMAAVAFENLARRFLQDKPARHALAPLRQEQGGASFDASGRQERRDEGAKLLFIGLLAGLYVIARIGLTYAIIGH
jgi:hypothetical protein